MSSAKIPAKPGKDTIYIDVDDEITSIIDKVEGAKNKVVALVLPKRATMLQSVVNMRLLKRNAEKAAKNVVLITSEEALLPLAGAVGLHVATNLQSKPEVPTPPAGAAKGAVEELPEDLDLEGEEPNTKLDYHRSVGELAVTDSVADESEAIALGDEDEEPPADKPSKTKAPKDKRLKVPNFDRFRLMLFGGIGLLILLIVFIVLAVTVLPKATITINTGSTPVTANLSVTASDSIKTLDEKNNAIPAVAKTTQQTSTQQVPATGQQNNGAKATGSISLTAEKCSGNPFVAPSDVPAGTGITSGGVTFITQEDTSFHGSGTSGSCYVYDGDSSTSVTAQSAGAKYNISGGTFSVTGRSDVSGSGSTSGGTDNIQTVVSQTDLNTAASKLTDSATASFTKNFESQLATQGFYVFTSTLKPGTPATSANPALGQPASNTTVTTTITYTVLAVNKKDFSKLITDYLNKQIDQTKQQLSGNNVFTDATISVQSQSSPSSAVITVGENTTAVPIINVASIKKQSAGQKTGNIKASVEALPGVKSVDVKLSPFWVSKAPKASKIRVVQQQVKGSGS